MPALGHAAIHPLAQTRLASESASRRRSGTSSFPDCYQAVTEISVDAVVPLGFGERRIASTAVISEPSCLLPPNDFFALCGSAFERHSIGVRHLAVQRRQFGVLTGECGRQTRIQSSWPSIPTAPASSHHGLVSGRRGRCAGLHAPRHHLGLLTSMVRALRFTTEDLCAVRSRVPESLA